MHSGGLTCEVCEKYFGCKSYLEIHEKRVHSGGLTCEVCEKYF